MCTLEQQVQNGEGLSEAEQLQQKVEVLLAEHEKLSTEAEKAIKAKAEMEKKLKDVQSKVGKEGCTRVLLEGGRAGCCIVPAAEIRV